MIYYYKINKKITYNIYYEVIRFIKYNIKYPCDFVYYQIYRILHGMFPFFQIDAAGPGEPR